MSMEEIKLFCEKHNIPQQALIDVYEAYLKKILAEVDIPETPTDNDILNELEEPLVEDTMRIFPYSGKDEDWKDGFFEGAKWMRERMRREMVEFADFVQDATWKKENRTYTTEEVLKLWLCSKQK